MIKDSDVSGFQQVLQRLIVNAAMDHPYHVIYVLIALRNAEMSEKDKRKQVRLQHYDMQCY